MRSSRTRVNRRNLLRGFSPARPGTRGGTVPVEPPGPRAEMIRASRPGMGSFFEVRLPAHVPGAIDLASRALDLVDALEDQMTLFRDDSTLCRLNASAHLGPVAVEPGLFALLERAIRIGNETGGAYDVTSGALSLAWGFVKGPRRVPDAETLADAQARTGASLVTLDPAARTVRFARPGVVLNLGSIGKGYAIDRVAGVLRDHWWPTPALVHGGQSSLYALGSPPGTLAGRWDISLRNPIDPQRPIGRLWIRNRGVGTSGAAFQQFESEGRRYGHIVDPRTGAPPEDGPASVTVVAPTAAEADALSTAFYLLGREAAARYCAGHPGLGVIFVLEGPGDGHPRVWSCGLSPTDFEVDPEVATPI